MTAIERLLPVAAARGGGSQRTSFRTALAMLQIAAIRPARLMSLCVFHVDSGSTYFADLHPSAT